MEDKDFIQVLQYYRHDLMNDMQVIQGYLSMDKIDKVKDKVSDLLDYHEEERKLLSIDAPKFILWVIQFNSLYDNMRLEYKINVENVKLLAVDRILVSQSQQIMNVIQETGDKTELYEIKLELDLPSHSEVLVTISVDGIFDSKKDLIKRFKNLQVNSQANVKETETGLLFDFVNSVQ